MYPIYCGFLRSVSRLSSSSTFASYCYSSRSTERVQLKGLDCVAVFFGQGPADSFVEGLDGRVCLFGDVPEDGVCEFGFDVALGVAVSVERSCFCLIRGCCVLARNRGRCRCCRMCRLIWWENGGGVLAVFYEFQLREEVFLQ